MAARRLLPALMVLLAAMAGCGGPAREAPRGDVALREADGAVASGVRAHQRDEYRDAIAWFGQGLARYRSIDDARGMVVASLNLADTLLLLGEHERAARHIEEARALVAAHGYEDFDAHLALLDAYARVAADDDDGARRALATLPAAGAGRDEPGAGLAARMLLADIAVRADVVEARGLLAALEPAVEASGDAISRGRYRRLRAELAVREADTAAATTELGAALQEYRRVHYRPGIAASHEALGRLHASQQRWKEAATHLERALHVRLWMTDRVHSLQDMEQLALAWRRLGDTEREREINQWRAFLDGDDEIPWLMLKDRFAGP